MKWLLQYTHCKWKVRWWPHSTQPVEKQVLLVIMPCLQRPSVMTYDTLCNLIHSPRHCIVKILTHVSDVMGQLWSIESQIILPSQEVVFAAWFAKLWAMASCKRWSARERWADLPQTPRRGNSLVKQQEHLLTAWWHFFLIFSTSTGSAMKAFNLSALNHSVMCLFPSHLNEPKLFVEKRDANASAVADCICICHGFQEC